MILISSNILKIVFLNKSKLSNHSNLCKTVYNEYP